jgi:hypothetical protein
MNQSLQLFFQVPAFARLIDIRVQGVLDLLTHIVSHLELVIQWVNQ